MNGDKQGRILETLMRLTNGVGDYAPRPGNDPNRAAPAMLSEIRRVEREIRAETTAPIEYKLAIALRNYTAWYVRGESRKAFLEEVVSHLTRSLIIDPQQCGAKCELARVQIDEQQVRDLPNAMRLISELEKDELLPDWLSSFAARARRWSGLMMVADNSDFSGMDPSPAVFAEERTKLRKLLVDRLKTKDMEAARRVGKRLYNLALLVAYLYGDHDCGSSVTGAMYDRAHQQMRTVASKFNFSFMGPIQGARFLSSRDYGRLVSRPGSH